MCNCCGYDFGCMTKCENCEQIFCHPCTYNCREHEITHELCYTCVLTTIEYPFVWDAARACCVLTLKRTIETLKNKVSSLEETETKLKNDLKEYENDPGIMDLFCRREIEKHCEEEGIL